MQQPTKTVTKVVVIFYSLYTHTWQLARAIVDGAKTVEDVEVEIYQVPELLSDEVINKMGATQPKEAMKHIPVITSDIRKDVIKGADAIFFGSPTRFGVMTAQMKSFFDALGGLWYENACVGKVASCFTGTGSQHGGQETTLFSMITPLLHLGFVYVGLPYSCKEQKEINEISGGSPYGATFIAGSDGSRAVSPNEFACARFQGRHVAQFAKELMLGRMALRKPGSVASLTASSPVASPQLSTDEKKALEDANEDGIVDKKPEEPKKKPSGDDGKGDKRSADKNGKKKSSSSTGNDGKGDKKKKKSTKKKKGDKKT
jgi:NAD(P)H dehydrogenase (quinone)